MKDFFLRRAREADLDEVKALLAANNLPLDGVDEAFSHFIVAEGGPSIVGTAGLEIYGKFALLRSAAVAEKWKGYGVGRALIGEVISRARSRNIESVFLLTTTAENYFPSFGFVRIERADIPSDLSQSAELRGACPETAIVMALALNATNS